jgi:hypothetical protein
MARGQADHWLRTGNSGAECSESLPKTVRPILFARLGKWKPEFDRREWKTLVFLTRFRRAFHLDEGDARAF